MSFETLPGFAFASDFDPRSGTGIAKYQVGVVKEVGRWMNDNEKKAMLFHPLNRCHRPKLLPENITFERCALPGKAQKFLNRTLGIPIEKLIPELRNVDIIHSLQPETIVTKRHWIVTVYDTAWRVFGRKYDSIFPRHCQVDAERAIDKADHLIAISKATADDIVAGGIRADKVTVIQPGIDERFAAVTAELVREVRERHCLPERFIAYVGTFHARKNIATLVRAVRDIRPETSPPLVFAGPIPPEGFEYWGIDGKQIRHIGYLDDSELPGFYAAADIFVFPSLHEGFGLPLVESMASGTAVVASDIPIFREVGGDVFLKFDPSSTNAAEQLRDRLDKLWMDDRMRNDLESEGRRHAAKYTWALGRELLFETYRRIAKSKR